MDSGVSSSEYTKKGGLRLSHLFSCVIKMYSYHFITLYRKQSSYMEVEFRRGFLFGFHVFSKCLLNNNLLQGNSASVPYFLWIFI